jgi:hypothetical protein
LYPGTEEGESALYQRTFRLFINGEPREALRFCRLFRSQYPNSYYIKKGTVAKFERILRAKIKERSRRAAEKGWRK